MGRFADAHIDELSDAELAELESLLETPEPDLYNWLIGTHAVPAGHDTALFRRLRDFALRKK